MRRAVSISGDRTVKVWDLQAGCVEQSLETSAERYKDVAVSADSCRAVLTSDDGTLTVWDLKTGRTICEFKAGAVRPKMVRISANGHTALTVSEDHKVELWDLATAAFVGGVEKFSDNIEFIAMSADARLLAFSNTGEQSFDVWDVQNACTKCVLEDASKSASAAAFSADGRRVVGASDMGTLTVWDLENAQLLWALEIQPP